MHQENMQDCSPEQSLSQRRTARCWKPARVQHSWREAVMERGLAERAQGLPPPVGLLQGATRPAGQGAARSAVAAGRGRAGIAKAELRRVEGGPRRAAWGSRLGWWGCCAGLLCLQRCGQCLQHEQHFMSQGMHRMSPLQAQKSPPVRRRPARARARAASWRSWPAAAPPGPWPARPRRPPC